MNLVIATIIPILVLSMFYVKHSESKSICRQIVMNSMEIVTCPPSQSEFNKELKYCCTNNGIATCCDINEYQRKHNGPSTKTIYKIIIVELCVAAGLVLWCCKCLRNRRNEEIS